jgi:hypothetical protein
LPIHVDDQRRKCALELVRRSCLLLHALTTARRTKTAAVAMSRRTSAVMTTLSPSAKATTALRLGQLLSLHAGVVLLCRCLCLDTTNLGQLPEYPPELNPFEHKVVVALELLEVALNHGVVILTAFVLDFAVWVLVDNSLELLRLSC